MPDKKQYLPKLTLDDINKSFYGESITTRNESMLPTYSSTPLESTKFEEDPFRDLPENVDIQAVKESYYGGTDELRARTQSTANKWGNAVSKMGITAGTTFLDGTVGTLWGAGELLTGGSFINNTFSNWMADVSEWQEKVLPNYYTQEELDNPWYTNLGTANFWADKVVKNFGFTIGAVGSGMAWSGAASTMLRMPALQRNVAKGIAEKFFNGNLDDALKAVKTGKVKPEVLTQELIQDAAKLKNRSIPLQWIGSTSGAIGESRIEAINNSRDFEELKLNEIEGKLSAKIPQFELEGQNLGLQGEDLLAYVDKRFEEEKLIESSKLKEVVDSYRNVNFWMDFAVLSLSNYAQFKSAFNGGYNVNTNLLNSIKKGKTIQGNIGEIAADLPTTRLGKISRVAGAALKNMGAEGAEEMSQGVVKETGDEFFSKRFDKGVSEGVIDYAKVLGENFLETATTPSKWEEGFIGAITGAISMPTINKGKLSATGGIYESIKEQKEKDAYTNEVVTRWNEFVNSDRFKNNYQGIVRHLSFQQDMDKALEEGNVFSYKNAQFGQFTNDVLTSIEAGRFEDLINFYEGLGSSDVQTLKEMTTPTVDIEGNEIPITERKSAFEGKTSEEIKSYYNDRSRKLIKKAKEIRDLKETLDNKFGTAISKEVKETLLSQLASIKDSEARLEEIKKNLPVGLQSVINTAFATALEETAGNQGEVLNPEQLTELGKVVDEYVKFNPTEVGVKQDVADLINLHNRRISLVNNYNQAVTKPGIANLEDKIRTIQQEVLDAELLDKAKDFKEGSIVVDDSGKPVSTIKVVNGETRLYPTNEDGTEGEPIKVNLNDKEFLRKYSVQTPSSPKVASKEDDFYIHKKTGEKVYVEPHPTKEGVFVARSVSKKNVWELSEEDLNNTFSLDTSNKIKRLYMSKKDGKSHIVYYNGKDSYIIKNVEQTESGTKTSYKAITKQELDTNYVHKKTYDRQSFNKIKNRSVKALETLIERTETEINAIESDIALMEPIEFIRKEISDLERLADKRDKRRTQASMQKILERLNTLRDEVDSRTNQIIELEKKTAELKDKRTVLYENLDRLQRWEEGEKYPIQERIQEVEQEIKSNEGLIDYFKNSIKKLKEFINGILNNLGLSSIYNIETEEQILRDYANEVAQRVEGLPDADKVFGKQMAFAKAKLAKYIKSLQEEKLQLAPTGTKIRQLQQTIDRFEQKNEDLMQELIILKEVKEEYINLLKEEAYTRYGSPISKIPSLASKSTSSTATISTPQESDNLDNNALNKQESTLREVHAARPLSQRFTGLAGKHYIDDNDEQLNPDETQRRYFRFTNKTNLSTGKYRIRLEYGESTGVEDRKYDLDVDKQPIRAYFINEDGQYIDEDGNPTSKDKAVFSFMPSVQYSPKTFKPESMTEMEYQVQLEKSKQEYTNAKTKIKEKLDKGEEVILPIIGKSEGVARTSFKEFGENTRTPLSEAVENTSELDIKVATATNTTFNSNKSVRTKPGFIYAEDPTTGNVIPLTPRKLSKDEVELVVKLWKMFLAQGKPSKQGVDFTGAGVLKIMDRKGNLVQLMDEDKPVSMFDFLNNILFFTGDNISFEGKNLLKENKITQEELFTNSKYWTNKNPKSSQAFHFLNSSIVGGELNLGGKSYPIMQHNGKEYTEHPFFERALREFLESQYINVNSILLNDNRGFFNVTSMKQTPTGEYYVEVDFSKEKEGGYKNWLLDSNALETRVISKNTIDKTYKEPVPQKSSQYAIYDISEYNDPIEDTGFIVAGSSGLSVEDINSIMEEFGGDVEFTPETAQSTSPLAGMTLGRRVQPLSAEEMVEEMEGKESLITAEPKEKLEEKLEISKENEEDLYRFRSAKKSKEIINIEKALQTLQSMLGDSVAVRVSTTMISGNNWGRYRDAIITLYENAGVGTEYHEAFHAVVDLYLTKEQKQSLFDSYRGITNNYKLTDKQVEEELAEDFANYALGNVPSYIGSSSWIKRLFKKLWNFITGMHKIATTDSKEITNLFDAIKGGKYRHSSPVSNHASYTIAVNRTNIPGFSSFDKKELLEGVNAFFFRNIFGSTESIESLFNKENNKEVVAAAYKHVEEMLAIVPNQRIRDIAKMHFKEIREMHAEYLKQYNLEFQEEQWSKDLNETERKRDSGESWAFESLKFSTKLNASRNIKLLIGSLPDVYKENDGKLKAKTNSLAMPALVDFGKGFNILINKLSNKTDWEDMYSTLKELSVELPWVDVLLRRVGGDKSLEALTLSEFTLRMQFQQTMAKTTNNFNMDMVEDNVTTIINSNQNSFAKRKIREWENSAKKNLKSNAGFYIVTKDGKILYNQKAFEGKTIPDFDTAIKILKRLGIGFSNEAKVKDLYSKEIQSRARGILNGIQKGTGVLIFKDAEGGNAYEDLNILSNIEAKTTTDAVENSLFNIDGELVYAQTLNNYLSLIINELNNSKTLEEAFAKMPHLKSVLNSQILAKFQAGEFIKLNIHEGSKQSDYDGNKKSYDDLKPADKLRVILYSYQDGNYPLLRPADNSIERFLSLGKFVSHTDISRGLHLNIMLDYLTGEVIEYKILTQSNWNNISKNKTKGVILDILKTVDTQLANELYNKVYQGTESVQDYINRRKDLLETSFDKYFDNLKEANKKLLLDNLVIDRLEDGKFDNNGTPLKGNLLTEESLNVFLEGFTINSVMANIEQIKLFVGNPMFYKTLEDEFKRHSGMVGTKKISIVSAYMNKFIEKYLDRKELSPFTNSYKNGQPILRTVIFKDIKANTKFINEYRHLVGTDRASKYENMDEGDAQGYIHLSEYRRMLLRAGDWTFGKGSLEEAYQYQIGRTTYMNPKTGEIEFNIEKNNISKVVFNALKPQHFGPMAEEGFIPGFYKLSVLPLLPKVIENFPNLKALNTQLEEQKTGLAVFASGNKIGTKLNANGVVQDIYDENGKFAFSKTNPMVTQDTYYKYWGIQVDMGNKSKNKVVWGTQMAKHMLNNLFSAGAAKEMKFTLNGEQVGTAAIVKKYLDLNSKRIELGYNQLVKKLGLTVDNEGNITSKDSQKLIDTLKQQALEDWASDNIIDAIEEIEKYGIDTAPNRTKLEYVLMSLADKLTISQKTFGKPMVQVSTALFEKMGIRTSVQKDKMLFSSNDLNFYKVTYDSYEDAEKTIPTKDAKIVSVGSMEVYLPAIYKGIFNKGKLDSRLLNLIGFRIPTQGLNSIESIIVKDFLPEEMGDVVVLPTEIVAKAGSDFDIDKLNMFIPNSYRDKKGNYHYVIGGRSAWESYQLNNNVEDSLLTFEEWEKLAVENELMEVMKAIVTSPDNAKQLISPNQVDPLTDAADMIEYLTWKRERNYKGNFEQFKADLKAEEQNKTYNNLVELPYHIQIAEKFLGGKSAVGITAIHSTFHILAQLNNIKIASLYNKRFMGEKGWDEKLESTKINLKHNSDNDSISIGKTEAADGTSIVEALSMWINAAVDAAKDPFMFKLNAGPQTLNVVLFLTMSGVSISTMALFMNQPIIKKYLELQNKYESLMADSTKINKGKKYRNEVINIVLSEFGLSPIDSIDGTVELSDSILEKELLTKNTSSIQAQILYDFIRYQDISKLLGEGTRGITYDTNGAGKTTSEMTLRLRSTEKVIEDGVLENYENILKEGFIKPYYNAVNKFPNLMREYMPHLRNSQVNEIFRSFIDPYFQTEVSITQNELVEILDKFKNDLLVYVIMTQDKLIKGSEKPLNTDIDRLFRGDNSMANRIVAMKEQFPRNTLLENLMPIFNKDTTGIDNAKMYITRLDTVEANQLTQDWIDLIEGGHEEFANDLIKFIILQSGLNNSPLNFITLAPAKYYNNLIGGIVDKFSNPSIDLKLKDFKLQFMLHNWKDKNIVPRRRTEGFPLYTSRNRHSKQLKLYDFETKKEVEITNAPIKDFKNNSTLLTYGLISSNISSSGNIIPEDNRSKKNIKEREYTPENIKSLKANEVFVFGANTAGGHGGGTAGLAQRGTTSSNYTALPIGTKGKWAEYGIVDKLMHGTEGKSFGIVTKAATISGTSLRIGSRRSVPLGRIEESINALIETAVKNPNLKFLVTKFGTNMAGFTTQEMKSLLENKNLPDNIILPKEFETREGIIDNITKEDINKLPDCI